VAIKQKTVVAIYNDFFNFTTTTIIHGFEVWEGEISKIHVQLLKF
jgi:hypothetical protein